MPRGSTSQNCFWKSRMTLIEKKRSIEIRHAMEEIPGVVSSTEQPLAHLISHMISGVKAQIGIKLYGDDLDILRSQG